MWQICWRWFDPPEFFGRKLPFHKTQGSIWVFPKIGVPQNGWFIMENPIKIDDLGVPLFLETPISWIPSAPNIFPKTSFPKSTPRANVSEITTVPGLVVNALNLKGLDGGGGVCSKIIAFMVREIQFYCYIIGILHTLWILLDSYGVVSWFLLFIITAFCLTSVFPDTLSMCVCVWDVFSSFFLQVFFGHNDLPHSLRFLVIFTISNSGISTTCFLEQGTRYTTTKLLNFHHFFTPLPPGCAANRPAFLQIFLQRPWGHKRTGGKNATAARGCTQKSKNLEMGMIELSILEGSNDAMQVLYIYIIYIYVFYICIHICIVTVRLPYVKFEFECVALQKSLK